MSNNRSHQQPSLKESAQPRPFTAAKVCWDVRNWTYQRLWLARYRAKKAAAAEVAA